MTTLGRVFSIWFVLVFVVTACGSSDSADGTTAAGSSADSAGGEQGANRDLEQPPGSTDPDFDEDPEGSDSEDPSGASGREESGSPESSPWGATRAEQCRPTPRASMNSGARSSFEQGVRAAAAGDYGQARTAFQQALSSDRNAYQAAYNLGVLSDRENEANRALDDYRRALRILPGYERAAEGIVAVHVRRGSVPEAIAFVQPLARQFPTNLHLQALYAEVLVKAGRMDDAWAAARRALRCDERFVPAMIALIKASLHQGRDELAERILTQALAVEESNAELHYLKGRSLIDEPGRLRDAMNEFRRAVALRGDYAEAHMALGIQLLAGANYPEALSHFQMAVRLAPGLVATHLNLADAYRASKQWAKAKQSFDRALRMETPLPQAHYNLGLMYMTAGESFPGLGKLAAMQKAVEQFTRYRNQMGPRLRRDDPTEAYLTNLNRQIERLERRRQRAQNREE